MFEAELERSGTYQIALRIAQRRFRSRVGSLAEIDRRASSLLSNFAADCPHLPKKCTHYAQNRHKQIKRLKTASILGEQRDGADPLAHDPSDSVNNGGIYGTLAYD
jgi:hypothetical protein